MDTCDVLVVGGGVVGLAIAWRLAQRGQRVCVLDAGHRGASSPAAAGMLAPLAEAHHDGPFVRLGLASLAQYPAFLQELSDASGKPIAPAGPGMLRVAATPAEADAMQQALGWQQALGLPLKWLNADALRAREPCISPALMGGVYSPQETHVMPRALHAALRAACGAAGVALRDDTALHGLRPVGSRAATADTSAGTVSFGQAVFATGAWTQAFAGLLRLPVPITPLRGQALTLLAPPPPPMTHTIYAKHGYLVPRDDSTIVVGATEEDAGFDAATTPPALADLRALASTLVPCTASLALHEHWAGLRPVTPDGLPLLGPVPGSDTLFLAAGHGRNGILFTPLTAQIIADILTNNTPAPDALAAARFATP